jgi:hypothetical protein
MCGPLLAWAFMGTAACRHHTPLNGHFGAAACKDHLLDCAVLGTAACGQSMQVHEGGSVPCLSPLRAWATRGIHSMRAQPSSRVVEGGLRS